MIFRFLSMQARDASFRLDTGKISQSFTSRNYFKEELPFCSKSSKKSNEKIILIKTHHKHRMTNKQKIFEKFNMNCIKVIFCSFYDPQSINVNIVKLTTIYWKQIIPIAIHQTGEKNDKFHRWTNLKWIFWRHHCRPSTWVTKPLS